MSVERGYRLMWDNLRLTVELHGKKWHVTVFHTKTYVTLHRTERTTVNAAKLAAVEFALRHMFGPANLSDAGRIAERFTWEPLEETTPR
jgi:hypothetical protein